MTCRSIVLCTTVLLLMPGVLLAQSTNATITGQVVDPSKSLLPETKVTAINNNTNVRYGSVTNRLGTYLIPSIPPGDYRIEVEKQGFKTLVKPDVVLHVQDTVELNFEMAVGSLSETVTVQGGAPLVNTESAAVSTVIDHKYVENMPLNGRSLQALILLTPGVVNTSPQTSAAVGFTGEFSVNGQRNDANYYMVDGVGANVGTANFGYGTTATSGALPAQSALGTTHNLVSLDALEEFRVESSTYSAEYGRTPGGQFSLITRSGTNAWHGSASDYVRNTAFDANNWFNDYLHVPNPGERQNDFGGTLGGPVRIPHFYDGKDRTFFFYSYEGVRLAQPTPAVISSVPSMAVRQNPALPSILQTLLGAFPVPNGLDLGNGLAQFIGSGATPSTADSQSLRLDHVINPKLRMFFRFANATSDSAIFGQSSDEFGFRTTTSFHTQSYTFGTNSFLANALGNEFRFNYTHNLGQTSSSLSSFGGGQAVDLAQLSGIDSATTPTYQTALGLFFGNYYATLIQGRFSNPQTQWNVTDTFTLLRGTHQLKFGVDYRRLTPDVLGEGNPYAAVSYFSQTALLGNAADVGLALANKPIFPVYVNSSLFAQDEWRPKPRLSLSVGLRWEVNPAPGARGHTLPYTVQGADNPSTMTVAPYGTPLWNTSWHNFAPRFGATYMLRASPGWETVARGGVGLFFDTGQQVASLYLGSNSPGYGAEALYGTFFGTSAAFPLTPAQVNIPVDNPPVAPYTNFLFFAFPPHMQLPYSLQWNVSIQQSLGASQAVTFSYVGSHAGRLVETIQKNVTAANANFGSVDFVQSQLTADYDSLQVQWQRRLTRGLQGLASYTWSHCIDYSSTDLDSPPVPSQRGNCDYDVRHGFSGAFSDDLPSAFHNKFSEAVLNHWGLDGRFTVRTSYPVQLFGNLYVDPATGKQVQGSLDIVPGQPLYVYGSQYPGGRSINPNAFSLPPANEVGTEPRNAARGFGAWQMDLAVRRDFPIYERLKFQFRAEAFNLFNHPNFGLINQRYCASGPGCSFGQATQTLNQSLGGLSPIYQLGGPRSIQLALKMVF